MSYAPHTNTDVQQQLRMGLIPTPLPMLFGIFVEADYGHAFEYAERRWHDDSVKPEFPHVIYVGQGEPRLALVKRTVAYVLTGEGEVQKWNIKQHREYPTDWVRA
jgi:hypothetical protein